MSSKKSPNVQIATQRMMAKDHLERAALILELSGSVLATEVRDTIKHLRADIDDLQSKKEPS